LFAAACAIACAACGGGDGGAAAGGTSGGAAGGDGAETTDILFAAGPALNEPMQIFFAMSPAGSRGYFSLTPDEQHLLFSQSYGDDPNELELGISTSNLDGTGERALTPPVGLASGPVQR
jgi:hypothetical protein